MKIINVLILGDHLDQSDILLHGLAQSGITGDVTGIDGLTGRYISNHIFDIVIFDICNDASMVPQMCQQLSKRYFGPIIVLSYESDERVILELYQSGIAESITKPIGMQLLVAKVTSWLRRISVDKAPSRDLRGYFQNDEVKRTVSTPEGKKIRLSKLEFQLFEILYRNRPHTVSTRLLSERIWGQHEYGDSRLKNLIMRLRRKIEPDPTKPTYIITVSYEGYRFRAEDGSRPLSASR